MIIGKHKAIVRITNDPKKMGRIKVECPSLFGDSMSGWCLPCVPYCYDFGGLNFTPAENELVWIEFEAGDISKPIWSGMWWSDEKVSKPNTLTTPFGDIEFSENGITISVNNTQLKVSSSGISITGNLTINGKDYSTHRHSGVESGGSQTGGVV